MKLGNCIDCYKGLIVGYTSADNRRCDDCKKKIIFSKNKKYYEENQAKILEQKKEYLRKNKERINESKRKRAKKTAFRTGG